MTHLILLRNREAKPVGYFSRRYGDDVNWTPQRGSARRYAALDDAESEAASLRAGFRLIGRSLAESGYTIDVVGD